jgi:phage baseplate assembly protein W
MTEKEATALQQAQQDYAQALHALQQPSWAAGHTPADPYGRTLSLLDGDLQVERDSEGPLDLVLIVGKDELAQCIQVMIGTTQGRDIFNVLFGLDFQQTLMQPRTTRDMRELVRLCVVKALAQEPRIRQIEAVAFVDEKAYLQIHPEITAEQQAALARQQRISRQWKLDVLLDTQLGDQITVAIAGLNV